MTKHSNTKEDTLYVSMLVCRVCKNTHVYYDKLVFGVTVYQKIEIIWDLKMDLEDEMEDEDESV